MKEAAGNVPGSPGKADAGPQGGRGEAGIFLAAARPEIFERSAREASRKGVKEAAGKLPGCAALPVDFSLDTRSQIDYPRGADERSRNTEPPRLGCEGALNKPDKNRLGDKLISMSLYEQDVNISVLFCCLYIVTAPPKL